MNPENKNNPSPQPRPQPVPASPRPEPVAPAAPTSAPSVSPAPPAVNPAASVPAPAPGANTAPSAQQPPMPLAQPNSAAAASTKPPEPSPNPVAVPPQQTGGAVTPSQPPAPGGNPKSLKKTIIMIMLGVVALMVIGFAVFWFIASRSDTYGLLELDTRSDFSISVPEEWVGEDDGGFVVYHDKNASEENDDVRAQIIVYPKASSVAGWTELSDEEKDSKIDVGFEVYKEQFNAAKPTGFESWELTDSSRERHPSSDVAFRVSFEGQIKTGETVKGEVWDFVDSNGDEHAILVWAEKSIWDKNEDIFKETSRSYKPS